MKIKIKKGKKVKNFKLIEKWSDVTLEKWLKLIQFKNKNKSKEALDTIALLSDIPKQLVNQLELKDIAVIMNQIAKLQQEKNSSLKRIIEIDGKEYGFHPDLDSITLGEYADIETFVKDDIEKHLPEVMAVLYRPIKEKGENGVYTIEAYDGNIRIRTEIMKKMSSEQVQSALVFFWNFGKELSKTLPSFLMQKLKEMKMQLQPKGLQKNGDGLE
ncbi:MAG: hypothetical protein Unbinned3065contig1007_6 [Prokaryotic dsDNA virus sp.]|nr:MAG: hypothetical protein Unbinned3065contig1007_6 [Prokaryotic dsDNA virus sp.]|tara:strand:- start:4774 stop:5418 length:645 start_codon:yes stop_codon:yes gene_type:complete